MASLQRDKNRRPVGSGVSLTDLITLTPLQVDPVTLRLLIDINISSSSGSIIPTHDKRDQNRVPTAYGVTDDVNKTLSPLIIDHTNGYLFVDITFT
jgi:hypothetical protein